MKPTSFIVAVTKIEGQITTVMHDEITKKSPLVYVEGENMRGDAVHFVMAVEEAPPINTVLRVSVEEV